MNEDKLIRETDPNPERIIVSNPRKETSFVRIALDPEQPNSSQYHYLSKDDLEIVGGNEFRSACENGEVSWAQVAQDSSGLINGIIYWPNKNDDRLNKDTKSQSQQAHSLEPNLNAPKTLLSYSDLHEIYLRTRKKFTVTLFRGSLITPEHSFVIMVNDNMQFELLGFPQSRVLVDLQGENEEVIKQHESRTQWHHFAQDGKIDWFPDPSADNETRGVFLIYPTEKRDTAETNRHGDDNGPAMEMKMSGQKSKQEQKKIDEQNAKKGPQGLTK